MAQRLAQRTMYRVPTDRPYADLQCPSTDTGEVTLHDQPEVQYKTKVSLIRSRAREWIDSVGYLGMDEYLDDFAYH